MVFYGAVGAVLGGRLGYSLFYAFDAVLRDPLFVLRIWEGGMSFHGGLLGCLAALWWFGHKTQRSLLQVTDFVAPLAPIGLGLGRLGNFANTELPGRASESSHRAQCRDPVHMEQGELWGGQLGELSEGRCLQVELGEPGHLAQARQGLGHRASLQHHPAIW